VRPQERKGQQRGTEPRKNSKSLTPGKSKGTWRKRDKSARGPTGREKEQDKRNVLEKKRGGRRKKKRTSIKKTGGGGWSGGDRGGKELRKKRGGEKKGG